MPHRKVECLAKQNESDSPTPKGKNCGYRDGCIIGLAAGSLKNCPFPVERAAASLNTNTDRRKREVAKWVTAKLQEVNTCCLMELAV